MGEFPAETILMREIMMAREKFPVLPEAAMKNRVVGVAAAVKVPIVSVRNEPISALTIQGSLSLKRPWPTSLRSVGPVIAARDGENIFV